LIKDIKQKTISTDLVRNMPILRPTIILFYLALAILVIWIILKLFGIIESPVLIETAPFIAITIALLMVVANVKTDLGYIRGKIESIEENVKDSNKRLNEIDKQLIHFEEKMKH